MSNPSPAPPTAGLNRTLLTRLLGPTAGLIQGDTLTRDRWLWVTARLPRTRNGERLLDVGCGTGAFTIGAACRGYDALGLTWDEADAGTARTRASLCDADTAKFEQCDVRFLARREDFHGRFDYAICCENIEHILDDRALVRAMAACLKPGGRLLLTSPNRYYRATTAGELGPFSPVEDGSHVRRGYSRASLVDTLRGSGLVVEEFDSCSGFFSQKTTALLRQFRGRSYLVGWALTLPLRPFIPLLDALARKISRYPDFSICLEAYKPRDSET